MKKTVAVVKCPDYSPQHVKEAVDRIFLLLGGIEKFAKAGARVLIKPNLLSAASPEQGITTHPELVKEVARRFKETGACVFIGDSPGGPLNFNEVCEKTGMKKIARELGVELVRFDDAEKIRGYPFAKFALECDLLVSLPKFKTHSLTLITAAIKNSFGLVPGIYKTHCHFLAPHPEDFTKVIVDVFSIRPPDLVIVDAVVSMEGDGPTFGPLRETGIILGGADAVSVDSVLAQLIGVKPMDIPAVVEAYSRKLGEAELENIEVRGEHIQDAEIKNFKLPEPTLLHKLPRFFLNFAARFINMHPAVNKKLCRRCGICVKGCPAQAIVIYNGTTKISRALCIKCLCCYEFCPHNSILLERSLPFKLVSFLANSVKRS
jgi:uncharacterized protein (DUF362 family)/Pyruvate/2-oxoacid:ferredoxin oxidoreductase delta subunit